MLKFILGALQLSSRIIMFLFMPVTFVVPKSMVGTAHQVNESSLQCFCIQLVCARLCAEALCAAMFYVGNCWEQSGPMSGNWSSGQETYRQLLQKCTQIEYTMNVHTLGSFWFCLVYIWGGSVSVEVHLCRNSFFPKVYLSTCAAGN